MENISNATNIISDINSCLVPANNIYWCNKLELDNPREDDTNFVKFDSNMPLIISNIRHFIDIYSANLKLCQDYPKLEEFSIGFFKKQLKSLNTTISSSIKEFKELRLYSYDPRIKKLVKQLNLINENLKQSLKEVEDTATAQITI